MPGLVATSDSGYRLDLAGYRLDRVAFEGLAARALAEAASGSWERALRSAERALALWRGAPFEELRDDEIAAADIARLLPSRPAIRLVKGAYDEPSDVAYRGRSAVDANYQALAFIPLESHEHEVVGVLGVAWNQPTSFDPITMSLLRSVGELCEQTLERSRLHDSEHHLVERLQHGALNAPGHLPGVDVAVRYESAMDALSIGGDWYDVIVLDDHAVGLVVGATQPGAFRTVRAIAPDLPLLVPGVGAQGGDLAVAVREGIDATGAGLLVASSRAVLYASSDHDWQAAARAAAAELRDAINALRGAKSDGARTVS